LFANETIYSIEYEKIYINVIKEKKNYTRILS